jgi:hypothetical protein
VSVNTGQVLCWKFPDADPTRDWDVIDGTLYGWRLAGVARPTELELATWEADWLTAGGAAANIRQAAKLLIDAADRLATMFRAVLIAAKNSDNVLRQRNRNERAAMQANATFASYRSAILAMPNLPDLNKDDIITALRNILNGAEADTSV